MTAASSAWTITPTSETSLVVEFSAEIDETVNRRAHLAALQLEALRPAWEIEAVVAWTTLSVSLIRHRVAPEKRSFAALAEMVENVLNALPALAAEDSGRIVEIPVCYGGEYGVDLAEVAATLGMSPEEVIRLHTEPTQRIFMLGFAPGQPIIGMTDERLSLPRRATPRVEVPARSVAIANRQSVVYSLAVPGGWHLIGRTPLVPFDAGHDPVCLWQAGDRVRFRSISPDEYHELEARNDH